MDNTSGKVKVLYYNHTADVSGAEISLLLTISHMPDSVETVLVAPEGQLLERAREQEINVIPIKSHRARMSKNVLTVIRGMVGTFTAGLRLRHVLAEARPEIVHANSIRAGLIAVVALLGLKMRLIWHVRDNLPTNLVGRLIRRVATWRVHAVITISRGVYENFATTQVLKNKVWVVHNGIDPSLVGRSIRRELGVPEDRFVLAVVGQIAPWKRQVDALEAFAQFAVNHANTELWIVGEPRFRPENIEYADSLKAKAEQLGVKDKVRHLGFRADVMDVMESIDVLLLPSENEPFGRVAIEAMLSGKPVIGTCGGGVPEIVVHHQTGYLYDIGDCERLAEYLSALASKDLRELMGNRSRLRVISEFSIGATCSGICRVYAQLSVGSLMGGDPACVF